MKNALCLYFRPVVAGMGAILFFPSCRREASSVSPDLFSGSLWILSIGLLGLAGYLFFHGFRERAMLRNDKKRLARLAAEQQKVLAVYRHQADWKEREDVRLLIERKERLAACLLAQLDMIKQRKLASGTAGFFTETEWEELIPLIDVAYDDFTLRLQKAYPGLTTDALRFCCLLKIGFSVEEIARLLSVTKDAVYKRRSRLKKDLLPGHDLRPLEEFLADF